MEKLIKPGLTFLEEALCAVDDLKHLLPVRGKRLYITLSSVGLGLIGLITLLSHQPQATAGSPSIEKNETQAISQRIHNMNPQELAKLIDTVNADIDHQVLYQDNTETKHSATNTLTDPLSPQEEIALLSLADGAEGDLSGRADPFSPLVQDATLTGSSTPSASPLPGMDFNGKPLPPKDVLEDIDFVGLIDEKNPAEKVAILKINDPDTGAKTLVKKLGESFIYDNHRIVLKKINRFQLSLAVNGKLRQKTLSPFVDNLKNKEDEISEDSEEAKDTYGEGNNSQTPAAGAQPSLKGLQE